MIGWQNGAALWALPLAALPVVIHLLRMHRAERVLFPSLRFVRHSRTAAVRIQRPSEWWLMALRGCALALAIAGLAGPVLLTPSRVARWNAATARAVVVDVSESMRSTAPDGRAFQQLAAEAADAETKTATYSRRIESGELPAALTRARAWLEAAPPARREIVVISDFQRGALNEREPAIDALPKTIGLRFVTVGRTSGRARVAGVDLFGVGGVAGRAQTIGLTKEATDLTVTPVADSERRGLRILSRASANALLRAVALAGAPAGSPEEPLTIRFAEIGRPEPAATVSRVRPGWMLRTLLRLQSDPEMRSEALRVQSTGPLASTSPWSVVAHDAQGKPLVAAASSGRELLIDVAAPQESLFAASVVRGVLSARRDTSDYTEREVAQVEDAVLQAWSRQASPVDVPSGRDVIGFWRSAEVTDARWCWLAVLAALGIEQWLRARRPTRASAGGEVARAA